MATMRLSFCVACRCQDEKSACACMSHRTNPRVLTHSVQYRALCLREFKGGHDVINQWRFLITAFTDAFSDSPGVQLNLLEMGVELGSQMEHITSFLPGLTNGAYLPVPSIRRRHYSKYSISLHRRGDCAICTKTRQQESAEHWYYCNILLGRHGYHPSILGHHNSQAAR